MSIDINDWIAIGIGVCIGILILYGIYAERGQREEEIANLFIEDWLDSGLCQHDYSRAIEELADGRR